MPLPRIGVVVIVLCEHRPQHAGMLVRNRNQRLVIALAFVELSDPPLWPACVREVRTQRRLQRTSGALNQQRARHANVKTPVEMVIGGCATARAPSVPLI